MTPRQSIILEEFVGRKFGLLTVLGPDGRSKHGLEHWRCLCDCGKEVSIRKYRIADGTKRDCGCLTNERISTTLIKRGGYSQDLTGMVFGRLTAIRLLPFKTRGKGYWECLCRCGVSKIVQRSNLIGGGVRSCGCLHRESAVERHYKHGYGKRDANGRRPRTWEIWVAMRDRCNAPNHSNRDHYGGRGIKVCPEWVDFAVFLRDMGECPSGLTIERLDVNGDYTPSNCVWADMKTQANNRTNSYGVKPTCVHGHLRTPDNTGIAKDGHHYCRVCDHIRSKKKYLRKKEKLNA